MVNKSDHSDSAVRTLGAANNEVALCKQVLIVTNLSTARILKDTGR